MQTKWLRNTIYTFCLIIASYRERNVKLIWNLYLQRTHLIPYEDLGVSFRSLDRNAWSGPWSSQIVERRWSSSILGLRLKSSLLQTCSGSSVHVMISSFLWQQLANLIKHLNTKSPVILLLRWWVDSTYGSVAGVYQNGNDPMNMN